MSERKGELIRIVREKNLLLDLKRRFDPQTDELAARERRLDTREQQLIIREEKVRQEGLKQMMKRPKSTRGTQTTADMQAPTAEAEAMVDSLQQPQLQQQRIAQTQQSSQMSVMHYQQFQHQQQPLQMSAMHYHPGRARPRRRPPHPRAKTSGGRKNCQAKTPPDKKQDKFSFALIPRSPAASRPSSPHARSRRRGARRDRADRHTTQLRRR